MLQFHMSLHNEKNQMYVQMSNEPRNVARNLLLSNVTWSFKKITEKFFYIHKNAMKSNKIVQTFKICLCQKLHFAR